jgi:hypothetical protein
MPFGAVENRQQERDDPPAELSALQSIPKVVKVHGNVLCTVELPEVTGDG